MKTTLVTWLAAVGMISMAGSSYAQYSMRGADGITASPKHREMLDQYKRTASARPAITKMACDGCRDTVTTRTDWTARGANKPTVKVVAHACPACETESKTTGQGKAARTTVQHTCGGEQAACCNRAS